MLGNRRGLVVWLSAGVLTLAIVLSGCAGSYSPEESSAQTATVAALMVPTATPKPEVTPPPTSEPAPISTVAPVANSESEAQDLPTGTQVGQRPPDFALADAAGQQLQLSDLRGQPTVVVFWASWCPHCKRELPLLQSLYEEYGDQGLMVVGVNVPGLGGDTKEAAMSLIADQGLTFPNVFDEQAGAYTDYRIQGVPHLFFIDRDGVLVLNQPGAMEEARLEEQVKRLMEEG